MICYIYREQWYKNLMPLNEECIFKNVHLVVVKMKSGTMKVVNMKLPLKFTNLVVILFIFKLKPASSFYFYIYSKNYVS